MRNTLSTLSCLFVVLGLSLGACVAEDESLPPPPTDEEAEPQQDDIPVDPPGTNIPGPGDDTCGAQLKGDGACTP